MTKIYTYNKPDMRNFKDGQLYATSIEFYKRERRGQVFYGVVITYFIPDNNRFTEMSKRFKDEKEGNEFFLKMKKNFPGLHLIEEIEDWGGVVAPLLFLWNLFLYLNIKNLMLTIMILISKYDILEQIVKKITFRNI